MGIEIKVAANGRMVLPADVRRRLGLENGGKLILNEGEFAVDAPVVLEVEGGVDDLEGDGGFGAHFFQEFFHP